MASSRSTRFARAVAPADVVSSRRVSAASASGSVSGNAPSASRRSSTIVSMRELDSMKCRCSAASSCSLSERLAVADSTPVASSSTRSERPASASSVSVRRSSSASCVTPARSPSRDSTRVRSIVSIARSSSAGGLCRSASCDFSDSSSAACPSSRSFVPVAVDASSSSCRLMPRSAVGVAPTGVPSCVSSRFLIVASSPSRPASPAAVVDTVVESVSSRWPRSPTFAVSSSICLEPPCVERSAERAATVSLSWWSSRGSPAAGACGRAASAWICSSRSWSSRRRLAISPSFFAIADAVVATVAANVSTRSLSTSRRATNRASYFESLLEDGSTTRRVFRRRGHRWVQGTCGHPHLAYRCGERVARSLVRVGATQSPRRQSSTTSRCSSVCGQPSPRASAMRWSASFGSAPWRTSQLPTTTPVRPHPAQQ